MRTLFIFEECKNLTFLYQFTTDLFLRSACNKLIDLLWLIFHISPSSNYYFQLLQHYCQYENGTRLISIATASRISELQTPHWHAALWLLHSRRPFFFLIQLFLVPVSIVQPAIPLSSVFFRSRKKWNCLEITEIAAGGLYRARFLVGSREWRDGQWNSPRNKMTGEMQKSWQ